MAVGRVTQHRGRRRGRRGRRWYRGDRGDSRHVSWRTRVRHARLMHPGRDSEGRPSPSCSSHDISGCQTRPLVCSIIFLLLAFTTATAFTLVHTCFLGTNIIAIVFATFSRGSRCFHRFLRM
jgi:hypothetical protein